MNKKSDKAETLRRLSHSVFRLEASQGHLAWKVTDLVRKSKTSRALIYRYLGSSKAEIFENAFKNLLYPLIEKFIAGDTLKKISPDTHRAALSSMWVQGKSYQEIHSHMIENEAWLQAGSQRRKVLMSYVVDACDGELAFDGMLVLGAIAEILEGNAELLDTTIPDSVRMLQKRIKYGLPDSLSVRLYELGFADRVISQELKEFFADKSVPNNYMLIQEFKQNRDALNDIFARYPAYFTDVWARYA